MHLCSAHTAGCMQTCASATAPCMHACLLVRCLARGVPRAKCKMAQGPAADAHRTISQRPIVAGSGARLHFIDDRWETVKAVHETPDLAHVRLYLADWCACTLQPYAGLVPQGATQCWRALQAAAGSMTETNL